MDRLTEINQEIILKEKEVISLKEEALSIINNELIEKEDLFKEIEFCKFFESMRTQIYRKWTKFSNPSDFYKFDSKIKITCISDVQNFKIFWNREEKSFYSGNGDCKFDITIHNFDKLNINNIEKYLKKNIAGRRKIFLNQINIGKEDIKKILICAHTKRIDLDFYDFQKFGINLLINKKEYEILKKEAKIEHILIVYSNWKNKIPKISEIKKIFIEEFLFTEEDFDKETTDAIAAESAFRVLSS